MIHAEITYSIFLVCSDTLICSSQVKMGLNDLPEIGGKVAPLIPASLNSEVLWQYCGILYTFFIFKNLSKDWKGFPFHLIHLIHRFLFLSAQLSHASENKLKIMQWIPTGKEICSNLVFCVNLGLLILSFLVFTPIDKAKWVS